MATYNKFQVFVENVAEKVHNLGSDQLVVALTNTAPSVSNSVLTDITEISYTYCSSRNITTSTSSQTSGTYKLVLTDLVLTASDGSVGPFRYIVIYNDTATNDPLICWYDFESELTLGNGETLTIDFSASKSFFNSNRF